MTIAVTAQGTTLDSPVDARFGRCSYFIFVDPETLAYEAVANDNARQGGGAGIASAQFIAEKNVAAVVTGNCGPNAFRVFEAADTAVLIGATGTVRDAVAQYKDGSLSKTDAANVTSHFGSQ
jgi:predicted Fe-Mo cluster-binding NifX family protein